LKSWARNLLPGERTAEIQRLTTELRGLRTHHDAVIARISTTNDRGAQQEAIAIGKTMQQIQRRLGALQSVQ